MGRSFDTPDVRQLREEDWPKAEFPVARRRDFRVYLDAEVHAQIARHADEDTSVEVGGVLVGRWQRDADGPFVAVCESIRCDSAGSKSAEVTFTHDAWAKINQEMDTRFSELSIVGWYHSHPDFGIFLSERDTFIQQHFFSSPGQIAYVVDPVRKAEGVFAWRDGKPTPCPHYWIGDRIHAQPSAEQPQRSDLAPRSLPEAPSGPTAAPEPISFMSALRVLAPYLVVFLLGYLIAAGMSAWEQHRLIEGTVAHYGIWKGLRPGLDKTLQAVDSELKTVAGEVQALSGEHVKLAGDDKAEKTKAWSQVQRRLARMRRFLAEIEKVYCLTPEEAAVVARIIAAKTAGASDEKQEKGSAKTDDKSKVKPPAQRTKE